MKKCKVCNRLYLPTSNNQKWCIKCKIRKCPLCNKEFFIFPCRTKRICFCSKSCANKTNAKLYPRIKTGKLISCRICKKETYRKMSAIKENTYCSKNCFKKDILFISLLISKQNTGKKHSLESIEKMKGRIVSKETREKMRQSSLGRKLSEECKRKLSEANKGKRVPFNEEIRKKMSIAKIGTHRPEESKQKQSNALKGKMPLNIMREGKFGNVKRGWYNINGKKLFFRSKWEVNYAKYLDWLKNKNQILSWEYEKDVFIFEEIKFGTRSFCPDFKIINKDNSVEYHEVKGWMTPKSKTQIKRLRKYYPKIKLILIEGKQYNDIERKVGRLIGFE